MPIFSNRATPIYYKEFRNKVLRGERPVNEYISLEMNRIDDLIRAPDVYYDEEAVDKFIRFSESEMTLTDGSDLIMLEEFKLWAEQLYGWYIFVWVSVWEPNKNGIGGRFVKRKIRERLIKKQFLIVGRGAAKSVYLSLVQMYDLICDTSTTHQITTAPTLKLAEEVLNPIRTAIVRARGPVFGFLTEGSLQNTTGSKKDRVKLASTKKGIEDFITNSLLEARPMTIGKLQGLRCKTATVDEWLSTDIREDPIGAIEQGASKFRNYHIVAASSEGTIRNGAGDGIKMELLQILKGEYINRQVSIFWYCLDDVKEVAYPELWIKANPNIGITMSYEAYHNDVERAEKVPSARNDILAKRFGIPCSGFTYFFPYEETKLTAHRKTYKGMACALGVDLSRGDDFCAFTFAFPLSNGAFGIKALSYITERTYNKLSSPMRKEYDKFIKEGSLVVMPGTTLKMEDVYEDLNQFIIDMDYEVVTMGYDPYNADDFVSYYTVEYGSNGITKVIQGAKTESVPLGELKKLSEDKKLLFDQHIMSFCIGNAVVLTDVNGNQMLTKRRHDEKIDNFAALMDAYIAYKRNTDMF